MATELTKGTPTSATLPQRRSIEYVAWLIVELGRLAAYLGKSDALDKDGYRASEMAQDLADTRPDVMVTALRTLRRETSFFPTTAEILTAYILALTDVHREEEAKDKRRLEAERSRLVRMAKERPEEFVNVKELITEALRKRGEKSRDE
jgi:hypothetical protein